MKISNGVNKKIIILIIVVFVLLLILGGVFYLTKGGFLRFGLLEAAISSLSQFNNKDVQTLKLSLEETKSELKRLEEENYLLKEKLEIGNEIKTDLELKYQLELENLAVRLEILAKMIDDFGRQMGELTQTSDIGTEFVDGEIEESGEKEGDVCFVDINSASKEELEKIIGVGPTIAQRIIDARPFSSIYDLIKVSGIGEITLQKIIDQGCAYVEDDTGAPSSSESISLSGSGGGGATPRPVTYPKILISEIQISPIEQRFIELYNPNKSEVNLTGWYLQRKTKDATLWSSLITSTSFEGKTIPPKGYFLISRAFESSDILFSALTLTKDNSIVLKNPKREIVDLVGWGEAPAYETVAFSENPRSRDLFEEYLAEQGIDFSNVKRIGSFTLFHQSLGRKVINEGSNYQDSDNNAEDFEIQTPTPKAKNKTFEEQELEDVLKNFIDYYNAPIETKIVSGPERITNRTQAIFEFQVAKEYCHFECRLNQKEWQECESPKIYEDLEEGEYIFSARAIDLFSNIDSDPPEYFWTIEILSDKEEEEEKEKIFFEISPDFLNFETKYGENPEPQFLYVSGSIDGVNASNLIDGISFPFWITIEVEQDNFKVSVDVSEKNPGTYEDIIEISYKEQFEEISVSLEIFEEAKNLLKNEFFEEWENELPLCWEYSTSTRLEIYQSMEVLWGERSLGIRHDLVGPINIEQHITSTTADLDYPDRAYGEIWVKGTGYIRIGIKAGQTTFSYNSWEKFDDTDWTSITFDRVSADTENTWQFRIQTTDRDPDATIPVKDRHRYNGIDLHIGAAWLSTAEPPENWPQN